MTAFVLLTALPPTTGHLELIQFAARLGEPSTRVLLNTQPEEPFAFERHRALVEAIARCGLDVEVRHLHRTLEQDPSAPGFWEMWRGLMADAGFAPGDVVVASEPYGQRLADECGGCFLPYDIDRSLNPAKATPVRADPVGHFAQILPEFQHHLRTTVTVFGAESTGKTTLSRRLAAELDGHWGFEYARPYLESTTNEITVSSMTAIWRGQRALQDHLRHDRFDRPFVVQDTDLFSTVGYWRFPHWADRLGPCPDELVADARASMSDLYVVTRSNIPFEVDPLRYGGTEREGSDEYWIEVCEVFDLPYVVLASSGPDERVAEARSVIDAVAARKAAALRYDRRGF